MPNMMPKRLGVSQSEAYREALVHATAGDPPLTTIELLHPSFVDDDGNPTSIRCVRDNEPLTATLEPEAPLQGGETVVFQPVPFELTLPEEGDGNSMPEVPLSIDNVTREIIPYVEEASKSKDKIVLIVRTYMPSDTSAPHEDPPLSLVLRNVTVTATSISTKGAYGDLINANFPRKTYTRESHPGLVAV